jgi:ketosteroid isomerase-like protein
MSTQRVVFAAAGLVAALCFPVAAGAQSPPPPDPAMLALPAKMAAAVIANDAATLRSACAAKAAVIDEFPPYSWSGTDACVHWAAGFAAFGKAMKMSGFKAAVAAKPFVDVSGDHAYMVAQVRFDGMMAGKPVSEQGTWTFVCVKSGGAWKVTNLTWGTLHH